MDEFIGFFETLWQDWMAQSPANRVAIAGTLLLPVLGWFWTTFRVRDKASRIERLQMENAALQKDCKLAKEEARREQAFANQWMPERWLEVAARERRDGNEEKAVEALLVGFENVAAGLARVVGELAGHSLSQMVERNPATTLHEAQRFAQIAALLAPLDREAALLVEEIVHARADLGEAVPEGDLSYRPLSYIVPQAEQMIRGIQARGLELYHNGQPRLAQRLFLRGVFAARRAGLFDREVGFGIRYVEAVAQASSGDAAGALEKVRVLLLAIECVLGTEHPEGLTSRFLEAWCLFEVGDPQGALEQLRALLPVQERVLGAGHPDRLTTQVLEAWCLFETGDAVGALENARKLLSVREREQGAEHPDALYVRYLEAQCLLELGETLMALEKVKALLPVKERVLGAEHPEMLRARWLRAKILAEQGGVQEALAEWRELLLLQETKLLPSHRSVRATYEMIAKYTDAAGGKT